MAQQQFSVQVVNLAEVNDYLRRLPETTFSQAKGVFQEAVIAADRRVKSLFGVRIQSRSGHLRRSLRTSVTGTKLDNLRASFYSAGTVAGNTVVYAPMQEYGGTIEAKNAYHGVPGGPYLNIPTRSNQTPAGVMKKSARMLFNEGAYIRKSRAGNWGVFLENKMMMVLKKRVHITPKLSMNVSADRQIPTILSSLVRLIGEE